MDASFKFIHPCLCRVSRLNTSAPCVNRSSDPRHQYITKTNDTAKVGKVKVKDKVGMERHLNGDRPSTIYNATKTKARHKTDSIDMTAGYRVGMLYTRKLKTKRDMENK